MTQTQLQADLDDDFGATCPGRKLTHMLTIVSNGGLGAVIEVLAAAQASGAVLDSLRLTRMAETMEHRLGLTGLLPRQARVVSERIAGLAAVERVRIEHRILHIKRPQGIAEP